MQECERIAYSLAAPPSDPVSEWADSEAQILNLSEIVVVLRFFKMCSDDEMQ